MEIGFIGLGKMGYLLAKQLLNAGYEVTAYDKDDSQVKKFTDLGGKSAKNLNDLIRLLKKERKIIWIMVPAGKPVDSVIGEIQPMMQSSDIIIDGGNSYFKDSIRRQNELASFGIHFLDCGTSGGLEGASEGACLMVGGKKAIFEECEEIFRDLAVNDGYLYCGESGSGHFVKMVHNGIEYGMMQAIAEGFELMQSSNFNIDLGKVARLWSNGSVIRGWLMELTGNALEKDPGLKGIKGIMHHSGEGKWTAQTALEMEVPIPVILHSLQMRFRSQQTDTFSGKVVSALRNEFGGHGTEKKLKDKLKIRSRKRPRNL